MARLMDKQWERIQQKTFTKWVNSHMVKRGFVVNDLVEDFKDGLKLIAFFEIISSKDIGVKYERKPRMRIHMIQNISTLIDGLIRADIADGNLKLVLGMIWTIILRFQIEDISVEELSSRDALLLWCKKKTEGYRDCKVENFHISWQDGMAFCAIIHRHRPDLINYDSLSKTNAKENLQLAFDVAEKEFGIPQLLDVNDIVDIAKPDERSIITYVSQYYHYFSAGRKQEIAGRRIGRLVDLTNSTEQMTSDYAARAKTLAEWIAKKSDELKDNNFPDEGLGGVKRLIQEFAGYRENEKPEKAAEKLALETLFNNIALKLRTNNRSAFVPPEGTSPSDIHKLWDSLLGIERDRDDALRKELERQERLDILNRRFNQKADKLEAWIAAKQKYLEKDETVDSLNSAKERIKFHDTFYDEYAASKSRLQELEEIAKEIASLNGPTTAAVQDRVHNIKGKWEGLKGGADAKKENLQKKLEIEERKEQLRIDFAKHAKEYNRWATSAIDSINDHTFGETLEDVQEYRAEMEKNDASVTSESKEKVGKLNALWNDMQALGITDLKYTVLTFKDIEARHAQIEEALKKRHAAYEEEVKRQLAMEQKRKEFAALALQFVDHLASRKEAIRQLSGEPEPLIESIKHHYNDAAPEKEKLEQINAFYKQMNEMGISENRHTEYTPAVLSNKSDQLGSWVRNHIQALVEEKELKALFASRAKEVLDWVNSTLPTLRERGFDNTLSGAQAKSAEFQQYKTGPKAEAAAKRPEIERLYESISALLKKSHRPEFNPPAGLSLQDIAAQWTVLEEEERKKEEDLAKELSRQEKLAILVRRFNSDAQDLSTWASEKTKYLAERETINTLFKASFQSKLFEAYTAEYQSRQPRLKALQELKDQIVGEQYHDAQTIVAEFEKLNNTLQAVEKQAAEKAQYLQAQLEEQQKNENLRFEFARLAKEFSTWVKESIEKIQDYNFGFTLEAVTAHKSELDRSDAEFTATVDEKYNAIQAILKEAEQRGITDPNKHSASSPEDVTNLRKNLLDALATRQTSYAEELKRQSAAEDLRKVFANKANTFVGVLSEERSTLDSLTGAPDEKITQIHQIHSDGAKGKEHLKDLTGLSDQMKSEGVYGNTHTKHTLPGLTSKNNQHNLQVSSIIAALSEEKELQERIAAQEAELREAEKKENMVLQFSAQARELNFWMENASESFNDPINVSTVEDAEKLSSEFAALEKELAQKEQDFANLSVLVEQMRAAGVNDFSGVTLEELTEKWNATKSLAAERKTALAKELQRQRNNDALCVKFATKAKELSAWLQSTKDQLAAAKGELEQQLESLHTLSSHYEGKRAAVTELESINKEIEAAGVRRNKHTDLSLRTLQFEYEQLGAAMAKQETLVNNEIITKKNADVSVEQLKEFQEVFKHFDKNHDGTLGRLELKACLQALGDEPSETELTDIMAALDVDGKGVNFQNFTNFMAQRSKDKDSQDEILESFKELANGKDFVTEEDLRRVMPTDKVNYLLSKMPKYGSEGYDYKAWVAQAYH